MDDYEARARAIVVAALREQRNVISADLIATSQRMRESAIEEQDPFLCYAKWFTAGALATMARRYDTERELEDMHINSKGGDS